MGNCALVIFEPEDKDKNRDKDKGFLRQLLTLLGRNKAKGASALELVIIYQEMDFKMFALKLHIKKSSLIGLSKKKLEQMDEKIRHI